MYYFWTLLLGTVALLWIVLGVRAIRGMAKLPRLEDVPPLADSNCPRVSILFAARDEAAKLPQALPTLLAQDYPSYEVIAVNDRSRDATPQILDEFARRHANLKVVHVGELPAGWLGKPHALTRAYQHATGEWLVFTDADVRFAPDLLHRALTLTRNKGWDHLSCVPSFDVIGFWEKTAFNWWLPGGFIGLEPWRVSDPRSKRYFGAGAFQLLRRSAYEAIGRHERLALEIVDDLKLGKLVKQGGFRSGVVLPGEKLRLRYEEGLGNLVRAFTKNVFAAADYHLGIATVLVLATVAISIAPFLALIFLSGLPRLAAGVAVIAALSLNAWVAHKAGLSALYALTHPLGAAILIYVTLRSTIVTLQQGGVVWRDTFYPLEDLRRGRV